MIIGHDENGKDITQKDIDDMLDYVERGDFSEFEDVGDCIYGQISPISEEKQTISFSVPVSIANDLTKLAEKQKCSKSDILRGFVIDGLLRSNIA